MDTAFCPEVVDEAIAKYGKREIFNTDQGSPFTSSAFARLLQEHGTASRWMARAAGATTCSSSGV